MDGQGAEAATVSEGGQTPYLYQCSHYSPTVAVRICPEEAKPLPTCPLNISPTGNLYKDKDRLKREAHALRSYDPPSGKRPRDGAS